MTFITGEQLTLLNTPPVPRSMLQELMEHLDGGALDNPRVCTLMTSAVPGRPPSSCKPSGVCWSRGRPSAF